MKYKTIIAILILGVGAAFFGMRSQLTILENSKRSLTCGNNAPGPQDHGPYVVGELSKIDKNLDLLLPGNDLVRYYSAGTFTGGKYQGCARILAVVSTGSGAEAYYFISDNKVFVYLDPSSSSRESRSSRLNWLKISGHASTMTDLADVVELSDGKAFQKDNLVTISDGKFRISGRTIIIQDPIIDRTRFSPSPLELGNLLFYQDTQTSGSTMSANIPGRIIGVDPTNVAYYYHQTLLGRN